MQSILVVDDDYAMRRGIALMLKGEGYGVYEADGGAMAAQVIGEHPIDLAIIDLFLDREDGVRVAEFVQLKIPDIKVLIVTAHGEHERAKAAQKIFKDHFLEKSSLDIMLLNTIEDLLRSKKQGTAHA
jgi:DNA-binding NtrC family response regulator